jgi:nucleoid DNA-binding protein
VTRSLFPNLVLLVSERAARKGRNPQTGAEIQIAEKFTAGKDLKSLQGLFLA